MLTLRLQGSVHKQYLLTWESLYSIPVQSPSCSACACWACLKTVFWPPCNVACHKLLDAELSVVLYMWAALIVWQWPGHIILTVRPNQYPQTSINSKVHATLSQTCKILIEGLSLVRGFGCKCGLVLYTMSRCCGVLATNWHRMRIPDGRLWGANHAPVMCLYYMCSALIGSHLHPAGHWQSSLINCMRWWQKVCQTEHRQKLFPTAIIIFPHCKRLPWSVFCRESWRSLHSHHTQSCLHCLLETMVHTSGRSNNCCTIVAASYRSLVAPLQTNRAEGI